MSSLAVDVCDVMAPISRQPGMLPLSLELAGTAGALRKSSVQYNIAPMSARAHLQGPSGFFDFFDLIVSIARSRRRSPNDIVSANSCIN